MRNFLQITCVVTTSTLCLGAAWLGVPHLWQPLPQATHHGAGRAAHVQQRAHRRGGQCYYYYGAVLLRINTCAGILSGHDIFLSAYWLGWAGLGWSDADFAIFIQ